VATALGDDEYSFISSQAARDSPKKTGWVEYYCTILCRFMAWNGGRVGYLMEKKECEKKKKALEGGGGGGVHEGGSISSSSLLNGTTSLVHVTSENCREVGSDSNKLQW